MSLLLKALKQAERQHREAGVATSAPDIELPVEPLTATAAPPEKADSPPREISKPDGLTLSPAEPEQAPRSYPSIEIPDPTPESTLTFADDTDLAPDDDRIRPEAFPRHAPPAAQESASVDPIPSAPYLRAGEAAVTLNQPPGGSIRLLALLIIGAAIGVAGWWTLTPHQSAEPLPYQPLPATTGIEPPPNRATETSPAFQDSESVEANQTSGQGLPPATQTESENPPSSGQQRSDVQTARSPEKPAASPVLPAKTPARRAVRPSLPAVRFVRDTKPARSRQSLLGEGYRALTNGELSKARAAYQAALRQDRNLIDAWVGLASVAAHEGNRSLAITHYQRALNIDPNDASARSGLIALHGSQQDQSGESALRSLLGAADNNPVALLALGSRLAAQGRWREAQQAYFKANTAQPDRPDTLFNLAVSLEQIRQPGAAIGFYERALTLAADRPHQFDPAIARGRLTALRTAAGN